MGPESKQVNKLADLANLIQVEVGNANTVWGRCTDNTVHTFDTTKNTFNLTTIVRAAMDIAANADGTLWHCHDEDPNAYRFISEATLPSAKLPLGQATVTGVHKLASTGFGAAHCLAQLDDGSTQVYRYNSPYLFKTAQSYFIYTDLSGSSGIVAGLGNLYFISSSGVFNLDYSLVAVDAHTGREVKRLQLFASTKRKAFFEVVFDPVNELLYVGCTETDAAPPQVLALNARDLTVRWRYLTNFAPPIFPCWL